MARLAIKIKRLHREVQLPKRLSLHAAGLDLYLPEGVTVGPDPQRITLGFSMELPRGYEAQIRPRSSSLRRGINVMFGTIDPDYRGEVALNAWTTPSYDPVLGRELIGRYLKLEAGDRIAQMVISRTVWLDFDVVSELSETERGEGGFGSTGR